MTTTAYIALGSNLGDRRGHLAAALEAIQALPGVRTVIHSPIYETQPVGGPVGQGKFLNSVAAVKTDTSAEQLLAELNKIEAGRGRDRAGEPARGGPRPLDLDILLFGDRVIDRPGLVVPHPRMHQRWFVLKPFCDVAPDVMHPLLKRSIRQLLADLEAEAG